MLGSFCSGAALAAALRKPRLERCEIVLDVPEQAQAIAFGFFLSGPGQVWADAFRLEVVSEA